VRGDLNDLSVRWRTVRRLSDRTATGQGPERSGNESRAISRKAPNLTKEVDEMAASMIVEIESGTYQARARHPHNGYYAGDFSREPFRPLYPATVTSKENPR